MGRRIEETDVAGILAYIRKRKSGGRQWSDVIYYTNPGRENPVNAWEAPVVSSIQLFNADGNAVISSTTDSEVAAASIETTYGGAIWVKPGHESFLTDSRWSNMKRIRAVE